jgi:hypothetical protein
MYIQKQQHSRGRTLAGMTRVNSFPPMLNTMVR